MKRKVVQIDEYRARQKRASKEGACYCDAVHAADELMTWELADLRRRERQPAVLRLESLETGVPVRAGGWDLIVSSNVFANLPLAAARQVVKAAVARLKPGGRLLLSNVSADARVGQCSDCRTSGKVGRSDKDMVELAAAVPADVATGLLIYRDYAGLNIYLELYKNAGGAEASRPLKRAECLERVICPAV